MNVASQENVGLLSSDEGGGSEESSSEDEVTEHATRAPQPPIMAVNAQVPTISVTPHSPGVLEDSLAQLRRLHAAVQRMRAAPLPQQGLGSSRLSSSCPSLAKDDAAECGSPTRHDYYPHSRKGSGESRSWTLWGGDEGRRSSWAAIEGSRGGASQSNLNGHSASLSSMESESEVPRKVRHSTHSLNDNDLAKDFEKVTLALRAGELVSAAGVSEGAGGRLAARLPLQKSVSTPSIVAAVQPPTPQPVSILTGPCASETESDEDTSTTLHTAPTGRRNNAHQEHLGLHRLAFLEQAAYDHHAEKRRKRGSLFFRKKKDKSRKAQHAWQAGGGNGDCDWCSRPLADKPSLYCDNCTMTVHQNVCKDYIVECNKPKSSKTLVGKSLSASSGKGSKRSSLSGQSQNSNSKKQGCYSPWRRVATKLGVHTSQYADDKDGSDHKHDQSNASDEACAAEWPEVFLTGSQLGEEALSLGLGATEPDTWAAQAPHGLAKQLGDRETKRQEHIYELILTEKHHCLTIRLMQKMFMEGMVRFPGVTSSQVSRMFPRVGELWSLHAALLARLRQRQRASPHVASVADILADTFAQPNMAKLKSAYGEFCSRHRDAVEVFKDCCARDPRLARFIRRCQQNPMLRKKGVPECVLFVAQRLTKYPLLLEPLLKTASDDGEKQLLQRALCGVKEILVDVDNQVAAKEREDRKLEIYHRIDAKSVAHYRGIKFKKSDVLQGNRSLKFEGVATLMQGRSKMQTLLVIVLTDVLFFLHDNNNKYTFFTPDNKTGVVSLVKLLVREKAGAEGRGLYLICSGPAEPEMFELRVHRPKDIHVWIQAIRAAVQQCPVEAEESAAGPVVSAEERQRQLDARHENIRLITEALRAKDREHATLLEEKMALHMKMVAHTGSSGLDVPTAGMPVSFPGGLEFPDYVRLAAPQPAMDTHALWQEVCNVVKEALSSSSSLWLSGGSLGRSTSSAGERHSAAYESPALPRRADTFAGFDATRHRGVIPRLSTEPPDPLDPARDRGTLPDTRAPHLTGDAALKLQHAIYTLACIVWHQLTTIHSLEATVSAWRCSGSAAPTHSWAHDAQLEELRHAQARLTTERQQWEAEREGAAQQLLQEKRALQQARQELAEQQKDVEQQRERLFRRLERLQQHGGSQEELGVTLSPESLGERKKETKWRSNRGSTGSESSLASSRPALPPPQLLSASNETRAVGSGRAPVTQIVKQQLPLKLASGAKSQPSPPGYQRLHESPSEALPGAPPVSHARHGSSPAPLPTQPPNANKATRTNTYPKLPDKFRVRSPAPDTPAAPSAPPAPPAPRPEEEVIYF